MKRRNFTDLEIIDGIINHNNDVFLFIYRQNFMSVRRFIEENNGTRKDAEDLFQDAVVLIISKIRKEEFHLTSSFGTYLFAIVRNQWLRNLNKIKKHNTFIEECDNFLNDDPGILEELLDVEKKNLIVRHFNELPEECKKIIELSMLDYSLNEMQEIMGYRSEQHTKNKKHTCRKTLIGKIIQDPRFKEISNEKT